MARLLAGLLLATVALSAPAAPAEEIDLRVDGALESFREKVDGADEFLAAAKGVLVFPRVIKAGFGIGGEYGEGALRIGGESVQYYAVAGASIGFQIGAQAKTEILVFMDGAALESFRNSDGWEAGVDGSVAVAKFGAGGSVDTNNVQDPIIGFIFGNAGLMYNLTLEGTKINRLER